MASGQLTFRLLRDPPCAGAWNMALDEALLHSAAETGIGTVRLYAWREPTISLGYFQPLAAREEHAASRNCAIVRRATGGGAIIHDRELTYSISVPVAARWSPAAAAWYSIAHEAWIAVLSELGLQGERCMATEKREQEPFLCFQRRATGDVLVGGEKIVGSAQRRHLGGLLQHGSVLIGRSPAAPELPGIADLAGQNVEYDFLAARWLETLSAKLGCRWSHDEPTPAELSIANRLQEEKLGHDSWLRKR